VYKQITGGVPRQIVELSKKTNETFKTWCQAKVLSYFDDLEAEFLKVSSQKQHSFLSFLGNVMEGQPQTVGIPSVILYDQGLFYVDDFGNYCVLNPIAREALD